MKNFKKSYNRLNKEQKRAVDKLDGPLMVVAGPGSGKTELLSVRAANVLKKKDVPPGSLLCLTYTDAAALNMKERLAGMIGEEGYKVSTFTFHSFCKEVIDNNPEYFYKGAEFDLADEITRTEILEEILEGLDYDDPLSSRHPSIGYVYLKPLKGVIPELKKAGITPDEFEDILKANGKVIEEINPLVGSIFSERVSNSMRPEIKKLIGELESMSSDFPVSQYKPLNKVLSPSLENTLDIEKTTKITAWKNKWTKVKYGDRVLKDYYYIEKHKSLAEVYRKYEKEMHRRGLYDFSDMILDVIKVLEEEPSLRYELQEKYLYIMVDEFQDTSGVQMRLLENLTKDEPHGKPNVCVVGDDDQAIYRFQGAEISNILNFKELYDDVEVVTLKKNYRSGQDILDSAKEVISRGDERLESKLEEVDKDLVSARKDLRETIEAKSFKTKEEEYSHVARKVKSLIEEGVDPQEIAVMGRKHKILKEIAPYFSDLDIPVYAERKVNVLENEVIRQIIKIIRFADYLMEGDKDKADELLPEILSYPFWNLKRDTVWRLARRAYKRRTSWFEEMGEDESLLRIRKFLSELAQKAKYKTAQEMIDLTVGNKKAFIFSPLKEYYFGEEKLKKDPGEYFKFLSALKRFTTALRSYKEGQLLKVEDLLEFYDRHIENGIAINDTSPLVTDSDSVSLITAHSGKGREFEAVFALSCQEEVWARGRRGGRLPLPSNLPLKTSETRDDHLRLFYVTLTRAKRFLSITSHQKKENGRDYSPLEFIDHFDLEDSSVDVGYRELESSRKKYYSPPFDKTEKELLSPLASGYMLSPTGFNKYLNVADGGPETFLQDTLLRFPSKKHPGAGNGTAVHQTINWIYNQLKREEEKPKKEDVLNVFEKFLRKQRLPEKDFEKYLNKSSDALKSFYQERIDSFSPDHLIEKGFRNQGVVISGQKVTGKIDKIEKDGSKLEVTDFKTGTPIDSWNPSGKYNKIKAWKYKNQLIFYKILIENSGGFEGCQVDKGWLEFIEPNDEGQVVRLPLEIEAADVKRVKELIGVVGERIKELQFSTDKEYPKKSVKEIRSFEDYLLKK